MLLRNIDCMCILLAQGMDRVDPATEAHGSPDHHSQLASLFDFAQNDWMCLRLHFRPGGRCLISWYSQLDKFLLYFGPIARLHVRGRSNKIGSCLALIAFAVVSVSARLTPTLLESTRLPYAGSTCRDEKRSKHLSKSRLSVNDGKIWMT